MVEPNGVIYDAVQPVQTAYPGGEECTTEIGAANGLSGKLRRSRWAAGSLAGACWPAPPPGQQACFLGSACFGGVVRCPRSWLLGERGAGGDGKWQRSREKGRKRASLPSPLSHVALVVQGRLSLTLLVFASPVVRARAWRKLVGEERGSSREKGERKP